LEKLPTSCPEIPHIQHNLAVLHANEQDWATAIEYFQKSLILDERARQSHEALARIHRFQAVLAYREALQSNSPEPAAPSFDLQSSRIK
ncbi:MAG: tetratricopeptide repeat protein, partial [Gammaproteobacteria bacterium]|nr:tetratricopeptide repeat protein [Gammaproteobacteria bacterium]